LQTLWQGEVKHDQGPQMGSFPLPITPLLTAPSGAGRGTGMGQPTPAEPREFEVVERAPREDFPGRP
jgi:hypothetical protein